MYNEGFGKKWIDKILGKVDKDQGVANAGKVLGIGNDGQVVPVEQSGGGSSVWNEPVSISSYADLIGKIKVGDELIATMRTRSISVSGTGATFATTTDNLTRLVTYNTAISDKDRTFHLTVTSIDETNKIIKCASNILTSVVFGQPMENSTYVNTHTINSWYVDSIKESACVISWTYLMAVDGPENGLGEVLDCRDSLTTTNYTVTTIIHKT